jgi:hypothetical protein
MVEIDNPYFKTHHYFISASANNTFLFRFCSASEMMVEFMIIYSHTTRGDQMKKILIIGDARAERA